MFSIGKNFREADITPRVSLQVGVVASLRLDKP